MKYKILGKTGVWVSELCFGTMSFGNEADETASAEMFAKCRDAGVNFFDCSNNYSNGRAEEILGNLIGSCRDEVVITSKVSQRIGKDINARGSSRRHIMLAVEQSLKRLKTDRIDVYFIHHFDPFTPMEETLQALTDLVKQGKVLYLGVSNWAAWQVAKALGISAQYSLARFECIEPMYNVVKRQAEVEILPLAESEQVGVIAYSPLGAGLLSGKYLGEAADVSGRIIKNDMYAKRYSDPQYRDTAARFVNYAKEIGVSPVTLAVSWVKSHPAITAPIIGARNINQLEPALASAAFSMTPQIREAVCQLSIRPASATDRLEEVLDSNYKFSNR
jgi:aryl-alcohol dehydrogenase-like predicted oxidoreductase